MNKRDVKTFLNRVLRDCKKGKTHTELELKYNININRIEDYFFWLIKDNYTGKIDGLKDKDYKSQREIYFYIMNDYSEAWVESKIYSYIERDFDYITVVSLIVIHVILTCLFYTVSPRD